MNDEITNFFQYAHLAEWFKRLVIMKRIIRREEISTYFNED
jgi:hypothetical protein